MENYCLPTNYVSRINNHYFDDTPYKDEYQDDVYSEAKAVFTENNYKNVLDIGTGSGFKLIKYFNENETIGVDLEPTLVYLNKTYPSKKWVSFDNLNCDDEFDLVICSDVIEHIPELNDFILTLNNLKFKKIVFSTPDKLSMYNGVNFGPPSNPSHVREWDMNEINNYLNNCYVIEKHFKSSPKSNTQIIVCSKK